MWLAGKRGVRPSESLANPLHVLLLWVFFFQTSFPDLIPNNSNKKVIKNKKGETSSPALLAAEVVKNKCHICFVQGSLWGGGEKSLDPYATTPALASRHVCLQLKSSFLGTLPQFPRLSPPVSPPASEPSVSLCLLPESHRDADRWTLWLWDIKPYLERTV